MYQLINALKLRNKPASFSHTFKFLILSTSQRYQLPTSWSSGNAFVSGAEGLRFKSQAGQIGLSVANGLPPLRQFFKWSCVARAQWRRDGPCQLVSWKISKLLILVSWKLQCITVSKMKDLIWFERYQLRLVKLNSFLIVASKMESQASLMYWAASSKWTGLP